MKTFQYHFLRIRRSVTSGSIAGLSVVKICRDGASLKFLCFVSADCIYWSLREST